MNLQDPVHVLCTLLGITPEELAEPCRILKVDPRERNAARIEDASRACFARIQSVQHHVTPEHGQWMTQVIAHARSTMLRAAMAPSVPRPVKSPSTAAWPSQEAPYKTTAAAPQELEPAPVIRTRVPKYQRGFSLESIAGAVGALVMCCCVLLGVGWFINEWWNDLNEKTRQVSNTKPPLVEATPTPPVIALGGGKRAVERKTTSQGESNRRPSPAKTPTHDLAEARQTLDRAVLKARQGFLDEALRLTRNSELAMPDVSEGLSLIIEYVKQYPKLADEAFQALNGNNEVDLGPPYGKGQFVEQDDNAIVFFLRGKHKRFTIQEFNGRKGVRFRVTRDFLDNADNPANDLILGSYHFLMQVNADGEQDGPRGRSEAERRIRKAIASGDPISMEQGSAMLKVVAMN